MPWPNWWPWGVIPSPACSRPRTASSRIGPPTTASTAAGASNPKPCWTPPDSPSKRPSRPTPLWSSPWTIRFSPRPDGTFMARPGGAIRRGHPSKSSSLGPNACCSSPPPARWGPKGPCAWCRSISSTPRRQPSPAREPMPPPKPPMSKPPNRPTWSRWRSGVWSPCARKCRKTAPSTWWRWPLQQQDPAAPTASGHGLYWAHPQRQRALPSAARPAGHWTQAPLRSQDPDARTTAPGRRSAVADGPSPCLREGS